MRIFGPKSPFRQGTRKSKMFSRLVSFTAVKSFAPLLRNTSIRMIASARVGADECILKKGELYQFTDTGMNGVCL